MTPRRRLSYALSVLLVLAVVAGAALALSLKPAVQAELTWSMLRNSSYPTSLPIGSVTLRDGTFESEAAPGSATRTIVRLADLTAFGDLDRNERPDAVVVLVTGGGGSGPSKDLVAVLNDDGAARPVARAFLGGRVSIREVRVEDRRIIVRLRTGGPRDPATRIIQETSRRYALEGDRLVLLEESTSDVPLASPDDFVYRPERLDLAPGTAVSLHGSLPQGQIASYVLHGEAGEVLDVRVRSPFDGAVLSVSGLSDGLALVSRREHAVDRLLLLPAAQDYTVKVVSGTGHPLEFALDLRLQPRQATPEPTARPMGLRLPSIRPSRVAPALRPSSPLERSLRQLSDQAVAFGLTRPPIWGVAVSVPAQGTLYAENADEQVPTASVVKVLVMLVVLEQARQERRPVSEAELALLWPMITESDNDSTSQLWEDIGRGPAVTSYLEGIGVVGFTPDPGSSWGVSFASARAMVTALGKLLSGEILDEPSRALALSLLDGVIPQQRWGVTAGTADGDAVGVKDGWYPGEEGWRVNSVGVVRPQGGTPYAIAIMTGERESLREGIETIEGVAERVNADMRLKQR